MPRSHAKLAPSAAERWINCPGSVNLSENFPKDNETTYTREGTDAHSLGELKLLSFLGGADYHPGDFESEFYCGEMEEATDFYADTVIEKCMAAGKDAALMVEQKLDLTAYVPDGFGSADAVIIGDGIIEVCDLKYGTGVKVEAKNNPQLRLYGLGALILFEGVYDVEKVRTTIIQPRLGHVSTEELSVSELRMWAEEEVSPRAKMAYDGADYFASGSWCRWCPAAAVCRKRAEDNLEIAKYDFTDPPLLDDDEIADILKRSAELSKWAKDVEDYVFSQMKEGKKYAGFKLVEGRSNRKYKDELEVAGKLRENGYEDALIYTRKILGITEMERFLGKKKFSEILGGLIIKPAGKPTMVEENDPRPEINNAQDDFKEEI